MAGNKTSQGKRSLWMSFVTIAQPYFFPHMRGGAWVTLLLLIMLLIFLFGLLFMIVAGLILMANHLAPELTAKITSGLVPLITSIFHSKRWLLAMAALVIPAGVFTLFGRHLLPRRGAWILLAVVLLLSLSVTGINVAFSYIGNYFTNALVKKNQDMAYLFVTVYFSGFCVGIPIVAMYKYVQDYLGMRWREWMTHQFMSNYFQNRMYYEIEAQGQIDNPDQRIMEDIRSFTRTSLLFLLILLGSLMDLISFSGILWSKSALLVGVVLAYSIVGTGLTALISRRLVRLNFNQLRFEADFRYSLVHTRDNAESIAFYQGEEPEIKQIGHRFREVLRNFSLLIGWQRNLSFFTTAYSYLPMVLPFLVLFPLYFGNKIEYGDMVQANFAFTQVYAALSLIVAQIEPITTFAAGVQRLGTFAETIAPDQAPTAGITFQKADRFGLDHLTLMTPNRQRTLIQDLTLMPQNRANLLVVGQSGIGKSSLLRGVAGLWTQGQGIIKRPPLSKIFFLPQRPYMLLGSLHDQLVYPKLEKEISETALREVLTTVRLEDLPERVGGFGVQLDWADVLSLGEQQRLAFARLLINQPGYAVLDEATSALDVDNETNLYNCLKQRQINYISVGHRPSIINFHDLVLQLQANNRWQLMSVPEYLESTRNL